MRITTMKVFFGLTAAAAALLVTGSASAEPSQAAAASATTTTTYYDTLTAQHSGDGLAVNRGVTINGEPIVAWPSHVSQHNTQFSLEGVGASPAAGYSGTFLLRARHSGQCIDVAGAIVSGAALVQQPCDPGKLSQQWYYGPASETGSDAYRYVYNRASGLPSSAGVKVMKVAGGGGAGTAVVLAAKDLFGSSRFAIRAPFKVTTTTEVLN
ncbi:RICIN domain-containing protein [Dactylosporangium cerinum]